MSDKKCCLKDVCKLAFDAASEEETKSGIFQISATKFAYHFKLNWFYNNNKPHIGSLKEANGSFVGVFQKNIEVTDISHPDTIVLIRKHTKSVADSTPCIPYFHSDKDMTRFLEEISLASVSNKEFSTKAERQNFIEYRCNSICKLYGNILTTSIIVDFYSTIFSIYIPITLFVDLEYFVAESGYIHSLGNQLYIRKAERSILSELSERIQNFVDVIRPSDPVYITPYSDEFFNNEDAKSPVSMAHGLDGLKISARKHHIGWSSILEAVPILKDGLNTYSLVAPESDDYSRERKSKNAEAGMTIFIMQDRSLVYSKTERKLKIGEEIYLVCYAQRLKNENTLHVLKESKPGWVEPVTLPHTLSSSLVNISLGRLESQSPFIFDPFCGTGTTLFDVALKIRSAKIIGFDRNPASAVVTRDNLDFLAEDKYSQYIDCFDSIVSYLGRGALDINNLKNNYCMQQNNIHQTTLYESNIKPSEYLNYFLDSLSFVLGAVYSKSNISNGVGNNQVLFNSMKHKEFTNYMEDPGPFSNVWLGEKTYIDVIKDIPSLLIRVLIYSCWRALYYNSFLFHSGLGGLSDAIKKEFRLAYLRYEHLGNIKLKNRVKCEETYAVHHGLFSKVIRPNHSVYEDLQESAKFCREDEMPTEVRNMTGGSLCHFTVGCSIEAMGRLFSENQIRPDLVITDPPYGFNTDEGGSESLEETFARLTECLCRVVAKDGVIAVTLPAQSKNGKSIPYYESKEMFVRQMVDQSERMGRKILTRASILPNSGTFPRPAWRWNSDRGVSRHGLVFKLQ